MNVFFDLACLFTRLVQLFGMQLDALNLPSLRLLSRDDQPGQVHFLAEAETRPDHCATCGSVEFYRHGGKPQAFAALTTALRNWRPQILAYFEHRATNAYTGARNNEPSKSIKVIREIIFSDKRMP